MIHSVPASVSRWFWCCFLTSCSAVRSWIRSILMSYINILYETIQMPEFLSRNKLLSVALTAVARG